MKKKAPSGKNIPEGQRGTVAVKLRLPPEVADELEERAERWCLTKSGAVAKLLEMTSRSPAGASGATRT